MDDPARLIYLLILLAAIGSGVAYMARQNLGKKRAAVSGLGVVAGRAGDCLWL